MNQYKYKELLQYVSPIKISCHLSKVYICGFCTFFLESTGILPLHNIIILVFVLEIQCVFCDVRSQLSIRSSSIHIAVKIHFCWGVTLCSCANTHRRFEGYYYLPNVRKCSSRPTFRVKHLEDGGTVILRNVVN